MTVQPDELRWMDREATCDRHGTYAGRVLIVRAARPFLCPKCAEEKQEAARLQELEVSRVREQERQLDAIGLRGWLRLATFETFDPTTEKQSDVLEAARKFAATIDPTGRGGLWLLGPPGVGKSHLGAAIAQAVVVQRGLWARMMTSREIVRELRATWRRDAEESEEDVIDRLGSVDLLVLDEVGVGFGSDAEATQLFEVIDRRYQLCRPTVVLSNLNAPGVKAAIGDRMFDRLQDGAKLRVCDWPSHRQPAKES